MSLSCASRLPLRVAARTFATTASEVRTKVPLEGLGPVARAKAEDITNGWKGTSASGGNTKNYIGGEFVESKAEKWLDVVDPVRA